MGRVIDDNKNPVMAATVRVRGTRTGTLTDANGFFRLENVKVGDMIEVSSVGYNTKSVQARQGYFTISLTASEARLSEVVVSGYTANDALEGKAAGVVQDRTNAIQPVAITTQYQPTTLVYKIDEKYTIETDNKKSTIGIKQFDMPGIYEYFSSFAGNSDRTACLLHF